MKKANLIIIILVLGLSSGCAKKFKKEGRELIEHQASTIRFLGYKQSVKVNVSPQEIEQYYFNPQNLASSLVGGDIKAEVISGDKFEKIGDRMVVEGRISGIKFLITAILVSHQPGEKFSFIYQLGDQAMGIIRYQLKPLAQGTKVMIQSETEEISPFLEELFQGLKITEKVVKGGDLAVAQMQAHFDPSLKVEEMMAGGLRGEFYDAFWDYHQASIRINAEPEKVWEALKDPKFWEYFEQRAKSKVSPCFYEMAPGPCPLQVEMLGYNLPINSFLGSVNQKKTEVTYYWEDIVRMQFSIKPEENGSLFSVGYTLAPLDLTSPDALNLALNLLPQLPKMVEERILIVVKNYVEGNV